MSERNEDVGGMTDREDGGTGRYLYYWADLDHLQSFVKLTVGGVENTRAVSRDREFSWRNVWAVNTFVRSQEVNIV